MTNWDKLLVVSCLAVVGAVAYFFGYANGIVDSTRGDYEG